MPSGGGIHRTTSVPFAALAERRARQGQPAGCVVQATAFISSSHLSTSDCTAGNNSGQACVAGDQFALCVHSPSVLFASGKAGVSRRPAEQVVPMTYLEDLCSFVFRLWEASALWPP